MKMTSHPLLVKTLPSLLVAILLLAGAPARAQKAYPVELLGLLGKIAIPEGSAACYSGCNHASDPSNGAVSITNSDPTFKEIMDQLNKINKAAMDAMSAPATPQAPSADQVQQMQQQAMQKATAAQSMSPQQMATMQQGQAAAGAPSSPELAVLKQMGQAQSAAGRINQLVMEMSQKIGQIDKSAINKVSAGPNCPEVQQGGYAGPTCACMKSKAQAYEKLRVAAQDAYLSQVKGVITDYLGKIKAESAIVDNFEHAARFGDAVSSPVYKQLVSSVQRQALGGVTAILGACQGNWEDGAKMFAGLVNANSGASVGCSGR